MPKVEQAVSDQVSLDVVRQPRASGAVPAGAFGGDIAQGAVNLAQAGLNIKNRIDTTSAEEALVSFERDKNALFFNPENGYFNTQGRNAFDAAPVANSALDRLKKQYGDSLNEQARSAFDKSADAHITRARADIGRHSSKGLQTWETATIEAQVENTIENASLYWSDPQSMRVQRVIGEQAIIDSAQTTGIGPEATAERLQNYRSTFASNAIAAATQSSSTEGQEQMDSMGDLLEGPDKVKLKREIEAKQKVEKTQGDAQAAVLTATNLVSQYDDRSDIQEQVNEISDPDLRKKTMAESMRLFSAKRQAESEARGDAFEAGESHIISGGSAETYKAENPEGWERLSPKQQKSLESGKSVITDWTQFSALMTLPRAELAKVDPVEHFNTLAPSERKSLISAVKSANGTGSKTDKIDHQTGRTRTSQTTAAVDQIFGKKTNRNEAEQKQVEAFYGVVDDERIRRESELDRNLTSEEYTIMLSELTRSVVQDKSTIFGFGIPFTGGEIELTDIPADKMTILSNALRDRGVAVTSDNLIKAFLQATE
jgi:hypothetical protein